MITGDHPDTARSIAKEIGLPNAANVVTGDEMGILTDSELKTRVSSYQFSRENDRFRRIFGWPLTCIWEVGNRSKI